MARSSLSLPHERTKARLKSKQLQLRVRQVETRESLNNVNQQLKAMRPAPKKEIV